jgi:hypothetical protein
MARVPSATARMSFFMEVPIRMSRLVARENYG